MRMIQKGNVEMSWRMGSIQVIEGTYSLIFERKINHPLSAIWQMLAER
jgi:hypothetical protein